MRSPAASSPSTSRASTASRAATPASTSACDIVIQSSVSRTREPIISRLPDSASMIAWFWTASQSPSSAGASRPTLNSASDDVVIMP